MLFGVYSPNEKYQNILFPGVSNSYPQVDFQNKEHVRVVTETGKVNFEYYELFNKKTLETLEEKNENRILSLIFGSPSTFKDKA